MAFDVMAFDKLAFDEITLDEMTFYEVIYIFKTRSAFARISVDENVFL